MSALLAVAKSVETSSDDRLVHAVQLAIGMRNRRILRGLTVVANNATVTLQGRTLTYYDKQLLLHAAQQVPGVRQIVDEVHVLPYGSEH